MNHKENVSSQHYQIRRREAARGLSGVDTYLLDVLSIRMNLKTKLS